MRFITHPTRVNHRGEHLSYNLHPQSSSTTSLHLAGQRHKRTVSRSSNFDDRTYFKLNAFNRDLLLNLSLSTDFVNSGIPVEYLSVNGSSRLIQEERRSSRDCFLTGYVQSISADGHVDTTITEEGWAAISNCAGQLVSE